MNGTRQCVLARARLALTLAACAVLAAAAQPAAVGETPPERRLLDDFEGYAPGTFPEAWQFMAGASMKDAREARKRKIPAVVLEQEGNRFLRVSERDDAHTLVLRQEWRLEEYPCVAWRWRVVEFPAGADERVDGIKDTAASVYVIFKIKRFLGIPRGMVAIRYLWSNVVPVGEWMTRRGSERLYVLESGTDADEWRREVVDIRAHYAELYDGDKAPDKAIVLGLRTDANSTHTSAVADYDDIELLARCAPTTSTAPPAGRVSARLP